MAPNQRRIISIFALISSVHSLTSVPSEMHPATVERTNDIHNIAHKQEVDKMEERKNFDDKNKNEGKLRGESRL